MSKLVELQDKDGRVIVVEPGSPGETNARRHGFKEKAEPEPAKAEEVEAPQERGRGRSRG